MKKYNILKAVFVLALSSLLLASCGSVDKEEKKVPSFEMEFWTDVPSFKEMYVDTGIFQHIGFAVPNHKLSDNTSKAGLTFHGTSMTAENEFKPDGIMRNIVSSSVRENFTSSNGITIEVPPVSVLNFKIVDNFLYNAKTLGLKMRGHVLVWHSQTPKAFFCKNFDGAENYVSMAEMDARQEWYIKSVLEHVAEWEASKNNGEHIVYCWDVVNEAASDNGATLRNQGSDWYNIYKNGDFIVNAFRYANKYAPEDVLLAYNDYNEYQDGKHSVILKIIKSIQDASKDDFLPSRIDVIGMQSHMQTGFPNKYALDSCLSDFVNTGLDIHITELDITGKWLYGNTCAPADDDEQKKAYFDAFTLYRKYAKTAEKNGVSVVTFWGLMDDYSWRASGRPLPFKWAGNTCVTKPAYEGILEASK